MHVLESSAFFRLVWAEPHMSTGVPPFHDFDLQRLVCEGAPATGSSGTCEVVLALKSGQGQEHQQVLLHSHSPVAMVIHCPPVVRL